jgi:hypothetical protein
MMMCWPFIIIWHSLCKLDYMADKDILALFSQMLHKQDEQIELQREMNCMLKQFLKVRIKQLEDLRQLNQQQQAINNRFSQ